MKRKKIYKIAKWVLTTATSVGGLILCTVLVLSLFNTGTCPADAGDGITYNYHDRGWKNDHGMDATIASTSCESCHEREFCNACHFSDNPIEEFHDTNYVYTHSLDYNVDRSECAACHNNEVFCNSCHAAAAGRPANHLSSGWVTENHAETARDDIGNCAVCHSDLAGDDVCLRCHQHLYNPHGIDFELELDDGPYANDPDATCYKCHVFGDN